MSGTDPDTKIYAVVGVPSESLNVNKLAIRKAVSEFVHSLMVASEPFAVASGMRLLHHSLALAIGARTTDYCSMPGPIPSAEPQ